MSLGVTITKRIRSLALGYAKSSDLVKPKPSFVQLKTILWLRKPLPLRKEMPYATDSLDDVYIVIYMQY
jgi:hypothetical protein